MRVASALARALDREIARGLGDADVHRIDEGHRNHRHKVHGGVPAASRPAQGDRRLGHEHLLEHDVVRPGAAHAERAPRRGHAHAGRVHGNRQVKHGGAGFRIVVDSRRHEELGGRRAAREGLVRVDAKASVHARRGSAARKPIGASARQEDDLLRRDAPQERVDRCLLVPPAPRRGRDEMRVHRECERRGPAVAPELAQQRTELGMPQPAAAQLHGDARGEEAVGGEIGVVVGDESIVGVGGRRSLVEASAQRAGKRLPVVDGRLGVVSLQQCAHDLLPYAVRRRCWLAGTGASIDGRPAPNECPRVHGSCARRRDLRFAPMDALSDVLRVVRLSGAIYLDGEFSAPWCVIGRADSELCEGYLTSSERIVSFHFITGGACWARLPDDPASALRIEAGEILVVPQGESHILGSATNLQPVSSSAMLARHLQSTPGQIVKLRHGGDGPVTRMVCGFLGSENVLENPLLSALPRIFKVDMRGAHTTWLESSLQFAAAEAAQTRSGSATVLGKLSELLFVEAIRRYIDTLPADQKGWLAGLRDRFVGRALGLLHTRPAENWTVEDLAKEVGLSRSALAQRFGEFVGAPPMQYLARWRLQLAAQQLRGGSKTLAVVAEGVGYESEAAFNRAFKREFGMSPAAWRRARGQSAAAAQSATALR